MTHRQTRLLLLDFLLLCTGEFLQKVAVTKLVFQDLVERLLPRGRSHRHALRVRLPVASPVNLALSALAPRLISILADPRVGSVGNQQVSDFLLVLVERTVQRRRPSSVFPVRVGAMLQQELDDRQLVLDLELVAAAGHGVHQHRRDLPGFVPGRRQVRARAVLEGLADPGGVRDHDVEHQLVVLLRDHSLHRNCLPGYRLAGNPCLRPHGSLLLHDGRAGVRHGRRPPPTARPRCRAHDVILSGVFFRIVSQCPDWPSYERFI